MQKRKFRILSAAAAGSLALAGVAITASSGTSPTAKHVALAGQAESSPSVNLDNCPILHTGYPAGGCVAQLQTDLNAVQGNHLVVDGIFGSVGSQTYNAVIAFQQAHGLPQDGLVGPATKQALESAIPGDSMPSSTVSSATAPPPTSSQTPTTYSAHPQPDDQNLLPYAFSVPDLGNCPPIIPRIFRYSNGVLAPQGCVASLQQNLGVVGFGLLDSGDYEPSTYAAVWNFQLAHSIDYGLSVTGIADSSTISALDKVANSPAALLSEKNGAAMNGKVLVQPPYPAPIARVQLQTNTQPTIEEPADDCSTTCDDGE